MNHTIKVKRALIIVMIAVGILALFTVLFLVLGERDFVEEKSKAFPKVVNHEKIKLLDPHVTSTITNRLQAHVPPDILNVPKSQYGESILRGKNYLENTFEKLPQFVGAKINCTNCHMNSGTTQFAGTWVGVVARFPQYRPRSAKVDTLTDRINDCFERSLSGKRLPGSSPEMTDIISYMTWLSEGYILGQDVEGSGMPKLVLDREPNITKGRIIYEEKCSVCHQQDGQGIYTDKGKVTYPALWGENSFNIGAGMARLHTAAGFVKKNMPLGQGGSLSDDEAWDVSAYFTQQSRPDFKNKVNDWIKGNKPTDVRY